MFKSFLESDYIILIETILVMVFLCLQYKDKNYFYPTWVLVMPLFLDVLTEEYKGTYSLAVYYFGIFFTHVIVVTKLIQVRQRNYSLVIFSCSVVSFIAAIAATVVQESDGLDLSILGLGILLVYWFIDLLVVYLATKKVFIPSQ